jgi:hypothetical protein
VRHISHAVRRWILIGIIALNTVLFGINLSHNDTKAAFISFLTACLCWIGVHFINLAEQVELSSEKKSGEENDDE